MTGVEKYSIIAKHDSDPIAVNRVLSETNKHGCVFFSGYVLLCRCGHGES